MSKESKAARVAADTGDLRAKSDGAAGAGMSTGVAIIGFLFCFIAGVAVMWGWAKRHGGAGPEISSDPSRVSTWSDEGGTPAVSSKDPVWGKRDAPVTVVLFSDFQCAFCARVEPALEQMKIAYPNDVRIVWKNYPLPMHPNAKPAAEAAQGVLALAGSDAFWRFHEAAFKSQQTLDRAHFEQWAQAAGVLDMAKYKAGLDSHTWADKVDKDAALGQQLRVNGTPALFVNGVSAGGQQPFDKLKPVIDQELQKARAKIAAGTPRDRVYVLASTENTKNAPAPAPAGGDREDTETVFQVPIGGSAVLGSPDALVTMVEFSDFQCAFCARVEPTLKELRDSYGSKLRIVWKNAPLSFHPRAEPAAELALEARAQKGDAGFWAAHELLFTNQQKLADEDLLGYAGALKLDLGRAGAAIRDHRHKGEIDVDLDLLEDLQTNGTPNFFINGRHIVGARPREAYAKIIDEEIKKAEALLAKGIAPARVYEELTRNGKGPPELEKKTLKDLPANDPAKGNTGAKVVIHEFSDFECAYCGRVEDTMRELMAQYGKQVKFVWHDLPLSFHADAPLAAQAAREAYKQKGVEGFWKMHDLLFAKQREPNGLKRDALDGYAREVGLDMDRWALALDTGSHKGEVDADARVASEAGITGTPGFVINGYFLNGAQPIGKFRKAIERALADAR